MTTLQLITDEELAELREVSVALRCCNCPPCNHYAPDYPDHWDEPCRTLAMIEKIITARLTEAQAAAAAHPSAGLPIDQIVRTVATAHECRPSLARGVERCSCGESKVGAPGWWAGHFAAQVATALLTEQAEQVTG